jgi:hypothetical protein
METRLLSFIDGYLTGSINVAQQWKLVYLWKTVSTFAWLNVNVSIRKYNWGSVLSSQYVFFAK